jgi:hypothetical protein
MKLFSLFIINPFSMAIYDIGGSEVKSDVSESTSGVPQNKTLFIEQLTKDPPVKPEIVESLTSTSLPMHFSVSWPEISVVPTDITRISYMGFLFVV